MLIWCGKQDKEVTLERLYSSPTRYSPTEKSQVSLFKDEGTVG